MRTFRRLDKRTIEISENGLPTFKVEVLDARSVAIDGKGKRGIYDLAFRGRYWQVWEIGSDGLPLKPQPYATICRSPINEPGLPEGCECWAGLRRGTCRHKITLEALHAAGMIGG